MFSHGSHHLYLILSVSCLILSWSFLSPFLSPYSSVPEYLLSIAIFFEEVFWNCHQRAPSPLPSFDHRAHNVIVYGPETVYGNQTTNVTGKVEDENKYIDVKIRYFGVYSKYLIELRKKPGGQNRST